MDRDNSVRSCRIDINDESLDVTDKSENLSSQHSICINDIITDSDNNTNADYYKQKEQQQMKLLNSTADLNTDKKLSYLNLACTVNGYSNLTTYDSKIRKDINISREVSPIRPSINNILHCPKQNLLTPQEVIENQSIHKNSPVAAACNENSESAFTDKLKPKNNEHMSLIQQRVERLYGSVVIVEGFYSPKKEHDCDACITTKNNHYNNKDFNLKFDNDLHSKKKVELKQTCVKDESHVHSNNQNILPVLRHLSEEFRAQLPAVSPKKLNSKITDGINHLSTSVNINNEVPLNCKNNQTHSSMPVATHQNNSAKILTEIPAVGAKQKDGTYFLNLLKIEEDRILSMANDIDGLIEDLSKNPNIPEDIFGFLRSASGKARLLATKKMKQFEGLCYKNLNCSPEEKFYTTSDDLQGFWDMINLQIDDVNQTFAEVESLKSNGWKKLNDEVIVSANQKSQHLNLNAKPNSTSSSARKKQNILSATALKRESQRKQFLESKRKSKVALTNNVTSDDTNGHNSNVV